MSTSDVFVDVYLWGHLVGVVRQSHNGMLIEFEYSPEFIRSDLQVAPLTMPLAQQIYQFPELRRTSFNCLPGLLASSLPDHYGKRLINAWLVQQGREPNSLTPAEQLCYTGNRGMGALEYKPATGPQASEKPSEVTLEKLIEVSELATTDRKIQKPIDATDQDQIDELERILRIGTSAGGARRKALVTWNPDTNELRSGDGDADAGFEHWLIKLDGVGENSDESQSNASGYGAREYAYYLMALAAGVEMNPCRLYEHDSKRHFMTKRFERTADGGKLHMQSLAALCHYDFRDPPGTYCYEQALHAIRRLNLPMATLEQQFRRMAFNIVARNQDDHVKNISFLMAPSGHWSLSPAYDIVYSYNPSGNWTSYHQMSLNGKMDDFTLEDFKNCAKTFSMKRGIAQTILAEVCDTVRKWSDFAEEAAVPADHIDRIASTFRLDILK